MKLIIGGAYQGKLAYAKKKYQIEDGWLDGRNCAMCAIETCRGIDHFQDYVKRMMLAAEDKTDSCVGADREAADCVYVFRTDHLADMEQQAAEFVKRLRKKNPNLVLVSTELGCGVVPVDKQDRLWREAVGRICTCIAAEADEVVRVVCGIGVRLT